MLNVFPAGNSYGLLDNTFLKSWVRYSEKSQVLTPLAGVDYSARRRSSAEIISRLEGMGSGEGKKQVFWLSDFQKSGFMPSDLRRKADATQLYLLPVPAASAKNVFVDSVAVEDEFIRAKETGSLVVYVRNAGKEEAVTNVKFFIDEGQEGAVDLTVPAESVEKVAFTFRLNDAEAKQCRIVAEDFPLTFDNEYHFILEASQAIRILNFGDSPGPAIADVFSNEPIFKLHNTRAGEINYREVEAADLIVLNEVKVLDAALTENLKKQVQEGAAVLIVPTSAPEFVSYQRFFDAMQVPAGARPASAPMTAIAAPDVADPFFRNVFEKLPRDIESPQAKAVLKWSRAHRDMLKFKDGSPFLSEFRVGRGRVFLMAAPLSRESSSFAANALFVPVMYKLAMYSLRSAQPLAYSFGSASVSVAVPEGGDKEQVYKLVKDSVEWIADQRQANGMLSMTIPGDISEAGFYRLVDPKGQTVKTLALNYDKRESVMDFYTAAELKELVKAYPNVKVHDPAAGLSFSEQFKRDNFGQPLWKYCLLLCLLALAAEIAFIRFL